MSFGNLNYFMINRALYLLSHWAFYVAIRGKKKKILTKLLLQ